MNFFVSVLADVVALLIFEYIRDIIREVGDEL
jgi:hypothetical protein